MWKNFCGGGNCVNCGDFHFLLLPKNDSRHAISNRGPIGAFYLSWFWVYNFSPPRRLVRGTLIVTCGSFWRMSDCMRKIMMSNAELEIKLIDYGKNRDLVCPYWGRVIKLGYLRLNLVDWHLIEPISDEVSLKELHNALKGTIGQDGGISKITPGPKRTPSRGERFTKFSCRHAIPNCSTKRP